MIKNCIKRFIVILLLNIGFSITLNGYVYDYDNQPKKNAQIIIINQSSLQSIKVLSNEIGAFNTDQISIGFYEIKVSHIGYEDYNEFVKIKDNYSLNIYMKGESIELDRTVVTGTRSPRHIKDSPTLIHVISNKDINNSSYATIKEMLEIAMPNVQMVASNHGDDRVKFQGLDNKYMVFLVDGDRVSGEFAGNIDFSMFNLSNVEKIEIVEGAMSVLYGSSAIGGVVNIITKNNISPFWSNFSVLRDIPVIDSKSLEFGLNKNKFTYIINLSKQESDGYDLTPQSEFLKTLEEYSNASYQHTFGYKFNKSSSIEFINKRYKSEINDYTSIFNIDTFLNETIYDSPLVRYKDHTNKIKYKHRFNNDSNMKIVFLNETYYKKYYYPYYYNLPNDYEINGREFNQGILNRKELIVQYDYETSNHKRILGFEYSEDTYESFNIFDMNGNILFESIFNGENIIKNRVNYSVFFFDEWKLGRNNELSFGLRIPSEENITTSLTYLLKNKNNFNTRFSYASGYREPSLKELYYEWVDHDPNIYGNPELKATSNNYYSISFDKRTTANDFSFIFYYNDIKNMISTEYQEGGLFYRNYNEVILYGYNFHYSRKINKYSSFKLVYNYTVPETNSNEILEGISKHAFRINFINEIIENRLRLILNVKYGGEKFNFDQEEDYIGNIGIKKLDDYILVDLIFSSYINDVINIKYGVKNISDYKDESRFNQIGSNILNNYDPGRRFFIELNLNFKKEI